jgi:hypothetical protein
MGTPIIALLIVLGVLFLLALFGRGGPTETVSAAAPDLAGLASLQLAELGSIAGRLFMELGFSMVSTHERPDRIDLKMVDPTPVTGQTLYVRCVPTPELGAVQSHEVQAALDAARGDNLSKAVVVTPGAFSDEARLVSRDAPLELIDGSALAGLLRTHLPDVANRLGIPR